jgi:hypothetical protein
VPLLQSSPLPKQSRPAPGKKSNSLTTGSWMIKEIRELVRSKLTGLQQRSVDAQSAKKV